MRPQCAVPRCSAPPRRLPESLSFLGTVLCDAHVQHLLRVRTSAAELMPEESFAQLAVLREVQELVHSAGTTPALVLLKGGQ